MNMHRSGADVQFPCKMGWLESVYGSLAPPGQREGPGEAGSWWWGSLVELKTQGHPKILVPTLSQNDHISFGCDRAEWV